jgi:hypothetical protein
MIMWTKQDKVLPDAYINVKSNTSLPILIGSRGVVALPTMFDWGNLGEYVTITPNMDTTDIIGMPIEEFTPLRETFKGGATKVLLAKTNGGNYAKYELVPNTDDVIRATKEGQLGNKISIVTTKITNSNLYRVDTFLDTKLIATQNIDKWENYTPNAYCYVDLDTTNTKDIDAEATFKLTGGTTSNVVNANYDTILDMFSNVQFDTITCESNVTEIKEKFKTFVDELREEEGRNCQLVTFKFPADSEAIVNVTTGVILEGGVELPVDKAIYWVAGITASATFSQSNTARVYPRAIGVVPVLKRTEKIEALQKGEFIFQVDNNQRVTVVQDINSLVTYTREKGKMFSKNRVIRLVDTMSSDFKTMWNYNYMGKVTNNVEGRNLYRGDLIAYCGEIQKLNGIENFTAEDVQVFEGDELDAVRTEAFIQSLDSMEKLYMTINVQ